MEDLSDISASPSPLASPVPVPGRDSVEAHGQLSTPNLDAADRSLTQGQGLQPSPGDAFGKQFTGELEGNYQCSPLFDPTMVSEAQAQNEEQEIVVSRLVARISELEDKLYSAALADEGGGSSRGGKSASGIDVDEFNMAFYKPQRDLREAPLKAAETALLFVDVQNYNCNRKGALFKDLADEELDGPSFEYFWRRCEECKPRWAALAQAFRNAGVEVMHTVIQSSTRDGRDRGLDYKISGFHVPPNSWDAKPLDCIGVEPDEMVLPKTTSSAFNSTTLERALHNMGVKQLVVCGALTDQCVDHTVRDACDLGLLVTMLPDACVTYSEARHAACVAAIAGYCRQRTCDQVIKEVGNLRNAAKGMTARADRVISRVLSKVPVL